MSNQSDEHVCPECGAAVEPADNFCEQCKVPLSTTDGTTPLPVHVSRVYREPPKPAPAPRETLVSPPRRALPNMVLPGMLAVVLIGLSIGIGSVIRRSPSATPSAVAAATEPPAEGGCFVPQVVGYEQSVAKGLTNERRGLRATERVAYDAHKPAGFVVSQEPQGGTMLHPCKGQITITISLGPKPESTRIPPICTPVPPPSTANPAQPPRPTSTLTLEPTSTPTCNSSGSILWEADLSNEFKD